MGVSNHEHGLHLMGANEVLHCSAACTHRWQSKRHEQVMVLLCLGSQRFDQLFELEVIIPVHVDHCKGLGVQFFTVGVIGIVQVLPVFLEPFDIAPVLVLPGLLHHIHVHVVVHAAYFIYDRTHFLHHTTILRYHDPIYSLGFLCHELANESNKERITFFLVEYTIFISIVLIECVFDGFSEVFLVNGVRVYLFPIFCQEGRLIREVQ
mmetsp:Transcript_127210/g.360044  ORF Transcript_127210/g.360044 Transcript_127210/m.360044 type:complete len:208 (-) Transcript_127210:145-768(-)